MMLSAVGCPRGHGRLTYEIGANDETGTGEQDSVRSCWCGFRERPPRFDAKARIAELNRRHRQFDEGTPVPLHIDTSPFPEEEW